MSKISAFSLAVQVEQMRNAQKAYFEAISTAKKRKLPADFARAKQVLETSKSLELLVDSTIVDVYAQDGIQSIIDQDAVIAICVKTMSDVAPIVNNAARLPEAPAVLNEAYVKLTRTIDIAMGKEPKP